jgi:hypothetical protein
VTLKEEISGNDDDKAETVCCNETFLTEGKNKMKKEGKKPKDLTNDIDAMDASTEERG